MQSTLREILNVFLRSTTKPRFWTVFLGIIILFAITGPFDTFTNLSLPMRFVYWSVTMIGSWLIAMIFVSAAIGFLVKRFDYPLVLTLGSSVMAAWPITVFLIWVIGLFFGRLTDIGFWSLLPFVSVMALVFSIIIYFILPDGFSNASQGDEENPLLARLPVGIRGPIKHMTMQDHYMQVTTTRGKELILMRIGDAVGMMPQGEGMQVHRSHWVGLKFIANTSRENGQAVIIMDDGATYPVSRTYAKSVREAGVL